MILMSWLFATQDSALRECVSVGGKPHPDAPPLPLPPPLCRQIGSSRVTMASVGCRDQVSRPATQPCPLTPLQCHKRCPDVPAGLTTAECAGTLTVGRRGFACVVVCAVDNFIFHFWKGRTSCIIRRFSTAHCQRKFTILHKASNVLSIMKNYTCVCSLHYIELVEQ